MPTINDINILISEMYVCPKNPCNETAPTEFNADKTIIGSL